MSAPVLKIPSLVTLNDVAPVIANSVDYAAARNQVFNLGADKPHTVDDLARIIADAMGMKGQIVHMDQRNEVKIAFADHSKAQRVFVLPEKKSLTEGVRTMADWVKKHGARESSIFEGIEILKNLPPSWAKVAKPLVTS